MVNNPVKSQYETTVERLSEIADVDMATFLYYQRIGLIDKSMTEYRKYSYITTKYIKFINRARKLGFSVKEIKSFLLYLK